MFVDTHCHIHDSGFYPNDREEPYRLSVEAGVTKMICVGTDELSSVAAFEFAALHPGCFAAIGIHPHDAAVSDVDKISELIIADSHILNSNNQPVIAGIGEIGLDYYYNHSPRDIQIKAFEAQIQLAVDHKLPISFHVREAFDDFWPILDNFHGLNGVLHSFTDNQANLEKGLSRGLYVGINGISTFTKDAAQRELYSSIPLQKLLLETDAPFLTPAPFRGKMNIPAYVVEVARHQADMRKLSLDIITSSTTANAVKLFNL
ncbi:MAG: TatD family hydrolase [Candidatus Saccharimonadaceae bacterium]